MVTPVKADSRKNSFRGDKGALLKEIVNWLIKVSMNQLSTLKEKR